MQSFQELAEYLDQMVVDCFDNRQSFISVWRIVLVLVKQDRWMQPMNANGDLVMV
jgi:hypothetical protein